MAGRLGGPLRLRHTAAGTVCRRCRTQRRPLTEAAVGLLAVPQHQLAGVGRGSRAEPPADQRPPLPPGPRRVAHHAVHPGVEAAPGRRRRRPHQPAHQQGVLDADVRQPAAQSAAQPATVLGTLPLVAQVQAEALHQPERRWTERQRRPLLRLQHAHCVLQL